MRIKGCGLAAMVVGAAWVFPFQGRVAAHGVQMSSAPGAVSTGWYPEVFLQQTLFFAVYLVLVGPLRERFHWGPPPELAQILSFAAGAAVFILAEGTPIHDLSDTYLFSAHMFQHDLLVFALPPLILKGTPAWLLRKTLFRQKYVAKSFAFLLRPMVAFLVFNAGFLIWHIPALYQSAVIHPGIHVLEHLIFIGTGLLMWWPLIDPVPERKQLGYGGKALYTFGLVAAQLPIAGPLTFLEWVAYPVYGDGPSLMGIDPLTDQQIGGIVMKIPEMILFCIIFAVIFYRWANEETGSRKA